DNVFELAYGDAVSYGELHREQERQFSRYNFEQADVALLSRHFDEYEADGERLVAARLPLPAYDCVLRVSHLFNTLEARGAISVTERAQYIARVRALAKKVIRLYLELQAAPAAA
ncbi:MAG: glycine--tRNA ligase subunit alpha, partial [Elusimicrobia bacterium]|nr:glycine--tRNA ligase subunit alpha [Elusimicrobiota bacterium]